MQTDQQLIARARQLFEDQQIDQAEAAYRQLAEQFPREPGMHVMVGICRKLQGDVDAALDCFNQAVKLDGDFAEGHFHLGQTLQQLGRGREAETALKKAIVSNPNHVAARVALARRRHQDNRSEDAVEMLKAALRADADSVLALNELAQILVDLGREDEADEHASRAVRLKPEDPKAQIAMSRVFQARGQLDFAEQCLNNALDKAPQSSPLWSALGMLLKAAGRDGEAVRAFERAEQVRRGAGLEPPVIVTMVQSLYSVGRIAEARQRLESLARHRRLDGDGLLQLAELRLANNDAEAARALLPQLESALPSAVGLVEAWLAEAEGDRETAARLAGGLHGDEHSDIQRHARLVSGRSALAAGDVQAGEQALKPLVGSAPSAAWLLAEIHRAGGDPDAARKVLESNLDATRGADDAQRAMTRARLAWLLDETGDYESAAGHLEKTGWQAAPVQVRFIDDMPESLHEDLMALDEVPWSVGPVDDGRPEPVFVLGWPGSGRESILAALHEADLLQMSPADIERRRRAIGLPLAPGDLAPQTESSLRMVRRRYFRCADGSQDYLVEPGWFEAAALPALACFFPQARVIVPTAEDGDLELHWRLSGFGQVPETLKAYQRDRTLFDHLRQWLPLEFIEISRDQLTERPEEAANVLGEALGLNNATTLADHLEQALNLYPIKPAGRWRHYGELLVSGRPAA